MMTRNFMTLALQAAPVAVTQPVTFLQLIWATIVGALVFHESVDIWVVAGGTLILTGTNTYSGGSRIDYRGG